MEEKIRTPSSPDLSTAFFSAESAWRSCRVICHFKKWISIEGYNGHGTSTNRFYLSITYNNTSRSNSQYGLHPSRSNTYPSDPDVDIITPDSEGPEDVGPAVQTDRDPQSDEIIKQLEKGLPSWPGFSEDGWMSEVKPVSETILVLEL